MPGADQDTEMTAASSSVAHDALLVFVGPGLSSFEQLAASEPGPVTTDISLPCIAYEDMMIEIEVIAMSE